MQVRLEHGAIMEEDHYYAYGLKIAAISSAIIPSTQEGYVANKYLYNDKELEDDGGLNWYDYGYRSYDAQIGRFPQLDPLTDEFPVLTPYQYASDEPIANVDMDGLESIPSVGGIGQALIDDFAEATRALGSASTVTRTASVAAKVGSAAGKGLRIGSLVVKALQVSNTIVKTGEVKQVGAALPKSVGSINLIPSGSNSNSGGTIRPYTPGILEKWSKSTSFLGKTSYNIIDDIYVTLQTFRGKSYKQHLGGGWANPNDAVNAFVGTEATFMPMGGAEAAAAEKGAALVEKQGTKALVKMDEETFLQATYNEITNQTEKIGDYAIHGTKGLVGKVFTRNIFYTDIPQELRTIKNLKFLIQSFESEAIKSGAEKLSIYGASVINDGLLNPKIMERFGYDFQKTINGGIYTKILKP